MTDDQLRDALADTLRELTPPIADVDLNDYIADALLPIVRDAINEAHARGYEQAQADSPPGGWATGL